MFETSLEINIPLEIKVLLPQHMVRNTYRVYFRISLKTGQTNT